VNVSIYAALMELKVVGVRLELVLIVVATDANRDDLASVYAEGASILDDYTASLAAVHKGNMQREPDAKQMPRRETRSSSVTLALDRRHVRVAIAGGHADRGGLVDPREILCAQLDLGGGNVLLQV